VCKTEEKRRKTPEKSKPKKKKIKTVVCSPNYQKGGTGETERPHREEEGDAPPSECACGKRKAKGFGWVHAEGTQPSTSIRVKGSGSRVGGRVPTDWGRDVSGSKKAIQKERGPPITGVLMRTGRDASGESQGKRPRERLVGARGGTGGKTNAQEAGEGKTTGK